MKDILYIANIRLPTEKAHGVQIMEMCSAFSAQGVNVELVVPKRRNTLIEDPFDFYKIKNNFTISRLSISFVLEGLVLLFNRGHLHVLLSIIH